MSEATLILSEEFAAGTVGVDRSLLMDGKPLETFRTFPSINTATGQLLGHAPAPTVANAEAAAAAARPRLRRDRLADRRRTGCPVPGAVPPGARRAA